MTVLMLQTVPLMAITAAKLRASYRCLLRAFDAFAEARLRQAMRELRQHGWHKHPPVEFICNEEQIRDTAPMDPSERTMTSLIRALIRHLGRKVDEIRQNLTVMFHPYRRELYYMRGPGPMWRAKHDLNARRTENLS
jgi:hypothetical protein